MNSSLIGHGQSSGNNCQSPSTFAGKEDLFLYILHIQRIEIKLISICVFFFLQ